MESNLGYIDSFKIFSALTAYYIVEQVLRLLISNSYHTAAFQRALRSTRKDSVYFGILLGAVISLSSFPFCANALWEYFYRTRTERTLTFSADVCITSRGVLWVSELNRLDLYPSYVYHHLGSIATLLFAFRSGSIELLFLPFSSLVSEIPGDFVWLLGAHRELDARFIQNPIWEERRKRIQVINVWVYGLMRVPTIPFVAYSAILLRRKSEYDFSITWLLIVFSFLITYLGWVLLYLFRQSLSLKENLGIGIQKYQVEKTKTS